MGQLVKDYIHLKVSSKIKRDAYGARARRLFLLKSMKMPVPRAVLLSISAVRKIQTGKRLDIEGILAQFCSDDLFSIRASPEHWSWGGPPTIINIGLNDRKYKEIKQKIGIIQASKLYLRFILSYSIDVMRLDEEIFDPILNKNISENSIKEALMIYEDEMLELFPQNAKDQLEQVLNSMIRAWNGTTARLLRQVHNAPENAGVGFIIQRMAMGLGRTESGSGVAQFVNPLDGTKRVTGRYLSQSQGKDSLEIEHSLFLTKDKRGRSLEEHLPKIFKQLGEFGTEARIKTRDELELDFTIEDEKLWLLDAAPARRSARAAIRIVLDLVSDGILDKRVAIKKIEPKTITELLHPQLSPLENCDILCSGIAASPGAATGKIVFTSAKAQNLALQDIPTILVKLETGPEDIRGMHFTKGVLTERGGMTSHAAVTARGLGLPCIVGANSLKIEAKSKKIKLSDGRVFNELDFITIDGASGKVISGEMELVEPAFDEGLSDFLNWAEEISVLNVRANADTPTDAKLARKFGAKGIGLCRTEQMFFENDRLLVMREMIFADSNKDRKVALDRLLPMQRADFEEIFHIMDGLPVCIRLFDPPLHEFLPRERQEMLELAEALDLPVSNIIERTKELSEFNPMLGMRGVRLGITLPEIYEMQARAIFEAAVFAQKSNVSIIPEIMIPLVSAQKEVELVRSYVEKVANDVRLETNYYFEYKFGVMVETPRAALRAGDIARSSSFMSFGTNDLTQMTYGLSRDDAGRFMRDYVAKGVYTEDPFHTLDLDGVGELLLLARNRGRKEKRDLILSVCGEHGGDPSSIKFCCEANFDYVSCSPFRVPVAIVASAHYELEK
jgi:pyruvate, orthophosphate dikinase